MHRHRCRCISGLTRSDWLTHSHAGFELQSGKWTRGHFIRVFHNMPSLCNAWATGEDHITYNYVSHSTANKLLTQWKGIKSFTDPNHRSKLYSAAGKYINMRLQTPVREIRKETRKTTEYCAPQKCFEIVHKNTTFLTPLLRAEKDSASTKMSCSLLLIFC